MLLRLIPVRHDCAIVNSPLHPYPRMPFTRLYDKFLMFLLHMEWVFHIGIAQSIFSAFLLFTKRNRGRADSILAIWMIFIAFELTHMFLEISSSLFHKFTSNFGFYSLTFGPFLFLYVSELTDKASEFRTWDLGHFIPYILFSVIQWFRLFVS